MTVVEQKYEKYDLKTVYAYVLYSVPYGNTDKPISHT